MRLGTAIERLVDNYKYASDKEWINDKVAWALYHTWKEADRTTESTGYNLSPVEDEPTTQTETQNSNLTFKTLEYCDICDHKGCKECIANALDEHCIPSQFKKQIEDECAKEYEELGLKELKELIKADRKDEPQKDCKKCKNYDRCKNNRWKCCVYQPKDEPQTDYAWGKCE